jgi:hypothetical protein
VSAIFFSFPVPKLPQEASLSLLPLILHIFDYASISACQLYGLRCKSDRYSFPIEEVHAHKNSDMLDYSQDDVLMQFTDVARRRGDLTFTERCEAEASQIRRYTGSAGWMYRLIVESLLGLRL